MGPSELEKATSKKIHDEMGMAPGLHEQTPEYIAKRKKILDSLSQEEKESLDPNRLHVGRSTLTTIAFAGFMFMLGILVWFITTCRNNGQRAKYR